MQSRQKQEIYLILHNVRSIHNVGSIFRTADARGVSKIFLTGFTPAPVDRFGRMRKGFKKVSLGAEKSVPWQSCFQIMPLIRQLKKEDVKIAAVEQDRHSRDYKKLKLASQTAFIFGNEVSGLPHNVLERCDAICEIPMAGAKESLNVSVAAGIVLFSAA